MESTLVEHRLTPSSPSPSSSPSSSSSTTTPVAISGRSKGHGHGRRILMIMIMCVLTPLPTPWWSGGSSTPARRRRHTAAIVEAWAAVPVSFSSRYGSLPSTFFSSGSSASSSECGSPIRRAIQDGRTDPTGWSSSSSAFRHRQLVRVRGGAGLGGDLSGSMEEYPPAYEQLWDRNGYAVPGQQQVRTSSKPTSRVWTALTRRQTRPPTNAGDQQNVVHQSSSSSRAQGSQLPQASRLKLRQQLPARNKHDDDTSHLTSNHVEKKKNGFHVPSTRSDPRPLATSTSTTDRSATLFSWTEPPAGDGRSTSPTGDESSQRIDPRSQDVKRQDSRLDAVNSQEATTAFMGDLANQASRPSSSFGASFMTPDTGNLAARMSRGRKLPPLGMRNSLAGAPAGDIPVTTDSVVPVEFVAETLLPTDRGDWMMRAYRIMGPSRHEDPVVLYSPRHPLPVHTLSSKDASLPMSIDPSRSVPVRIHDQCITSEVFHSQRCDCREQLNMALEYIQEHGGCLIYLQQEGRGIGLANKVAAYALQQQYGMDTVDANLHLGFPEDVREYGVIPSILRDLGVSSVQLLTNNPRKVQHLQQLGVEITQTIPMVVPTVSSHNRQYLETKRRRMNHNNLDDLLSSSAPFSASPTAATKITGGSVDLVDGKLSAETDGFKVNGSVESVAYNDFVQLQSTNGYQTDKMEADPSVAGGKADEVKDIEDPDRQTTDELGVKAADDGYCFGKQSVLDAIEAIAQGKMVVVVDDMDRENEGDFIMAADLCSGVHMAKIIRYSSGVVCVAMPGGRMDELKLPPMVVNNEDPKGTAFSVSVDATKKHGISTGISAADRATTVQLLADPSSQSSDFHRPGHLFPLRAREGGVLERDGHTEASVDLARLAGRSPVGVLCEIVSEDFPTEMMRLPELKRFCQRHGFVMTSIVDIAQYRRETGL